ncbi:MAG: hypothetical protein DI548_02860 [Flavobacterium johnsoniae]|nr:MAG: hypothetical protein DI548_02860 [Flavobacterium johnsoniae]
MSVHGVGSSMEFSGGPPTTRTTPDSGLGEDRGMRVPPGFVSFFFLNFNSFLVDNASGNVCTPDDGRSSRSFL